LDFRVPLLKRSGTSPAAIRLVFFRNPFCLHSPHRQPTRQLYAIWYMYSAYPGNQVVAQARCPPADNNI